MKTARARGRARLDPPRRPRSATCSSPAATRWCSPTTSSSWLHRRAARDPARRDRPARHAAAGDAAVPRHRRALPDARAPPSDLGEHALQPPEGAHPGGRGGRATGCSRAGMPGREPERAARRASTTTSATMKALCEGLGADARPPVLLLPGAAPRRHRALPRADRAGIEIFRELRGRTSGYAIPTYVLDTPYGKVPLSYPYLRGRDGDHVVVEA